jgi:hypothetical protein
MREERQLENRQYEQTSNHKEVQLMEKDDREMSSLLSETENGSSLDKLLSKAIRDKNGQPDLTGNMLSLTEINLTKIFIQGEIERQLIKGHS